MLNKNDYGERVILLTAASLLSFSGNLNNLIHYRPSARTQVSYSYMSRSPDDTSDAPPVDPSPNSGLSRQVRRLCADGYRLYDSGEYRLALRSFYQAWLIIPKPQTQYAEAGWVLTAIGDGYFRLKQYEPGAESLQSALCCPTAEQSPFVQLRLGQCLWELGRHAEARKCLFHAYQSQGETLFESEPPRYRKAIEDLLPHE